MIVDKQDIDFCKSRVKVSYDSDKVTEVVNSIAKEVGSKIKLSGFRNKAPLEAVKVAAYKLIVEHLKDKLVTEAVEDSVFEYKWKLLGRPLVLDINANYSKFDADIVIGYKPEVELKQYKDFELNFSEFSTEFYKERFIENTLEHDAQQVPYTEDDFVLSGDNVVIDFESFIDGQPFEGSKGESVVLEIGKGGTLPGFEDNIMGMRPDEQREFSIVLDENLSNKTIAGKEVKFTVKLLSASKKTLPELNDEFAKSKGFESVEKLTEAAETKALSYIQEQKFFGVKLALIEKLLETNQLEVPEWAVVSSAKDYIKRENGSYDDLPEEHKTELLKQATNKLKLNLILDKVKELEADAQLADEELRRLVDHNMPRLPQNIQDAILKNRDVNTYAEVMNDIQNEYALKWISDHCVQATKEVSVEQ